MISRPLLLSRSLLLLLLSLATCYGLEHRIVQFNDKDKKEDLRPGRAWPYKTVGQQAFLIAWGKAAQDRSYVVIEHGDRLRKPAIVATIHKETGKLRVVYAGTAFYDSRGCIHIDCRKAKVTGPESRTWSPDSFSITMDGKVQCIDDRQRTANPGHVLRWFNKEKSVYKDTKHANSTDSVEQALCYQSIRLLTRVHLEGVL